VLDPVLDPGCIKCCKGAKASFKVQTVSSARKTVNRLDYAEKSKEHPTGEIVSYCTSIGSSKP
jgi:hypothetical protein